MPNFVSCLRNKRERFANRLKRIVHSGFNSRVLSFSIKRDALIEKALHSNEEGVSSEKLCEYEVVVSLTTYGRRLYDVAPTIESVMQGSMKPNRIVLWLGEDLREITIPIALQRQQKRGLEICYCKDIRSYTKLIPTLVKYPEAATITIDDDAIYPYDLVERLVHEHKRFPGNIIANRIHRVKLGKNCLPINYMKWDLLAHCVGDSPLNFLTGVGGVLYPPHSLDSEVLNEQVFLDICKYADDVWFYAMALKAGTFVRKCPTHDLGGEDYLLNESLQSFGLLNINTTRSKERCANDVQLEAVFNRYALWDKLKTGQDSAL